MLKIRLVFTTLTVNDYMKFKFRTVFIVNHVLKVLIVPKVPLINENRILKGEEYINNLTP
jgi:hypothetical protein